MITFTYSDNSEAVEKSLAGFQAALADEASALGEVADDFREMVAEQFATEGRAGGTPWAPVAPRSRRGTGVPPVNTRRMRVPLVRTGALRDSLTRKGAAGSMEDTDGQTLSIGSRLPYAIFHQFGTRQMPARPLIVLSDARSAKWAEFVRRAIEEKTHLLGAKELGGQR
jgi:phage gpG-like protein